MVKSFSLTVRYGDLVLPIIQPLLLTYHAKVHD